MKKKLGKEEQKRQKERLAKKLTIRRDYETPSVRIESKLASPSFAAVVKSIVENIDLFDPSLFSPLVQQHFRNLKIHGDRFATIESVRASGRKVSSQNDLGKFGLWITSALGDAIVDKLEDDIIPMNDVEVHFLGNEIVLALSSMLERTVMSREFFHSRGRFAIEVDSKKYVLAFTKHTIDAICSRYRPDFQTYLGLGEAHAIFSYLNYAEVMRLPEGNLAVSIFDFCMGPGTWQYDNYVGRCLPGVAPRGPEVWRETQRPYGHRMGYCPIDLVGEYAVTRTFLPPGFAKTPERQQLRLNCADPLKRFRLTRIAQNMNYNALRRGNGFEAVEWFHKNGVPQVIDPPVPLFDEGYFKLKVGLE